MSSKVYFIKAAMNEGNTTISEKAVKLFNAGGFAACFAKEDFTAVKVHIGEGINNTYIPAPCIRGLVDGLKALQVKPFITDTSTLYTGRRHNAIDHTILASEHGFDYQGLGAPFIATDGLFGSNETSVTINGELNSEVSIASDIVRCQSILSIAHFTGHLAACEAATIKTLGMGCASRKGKMRQHAALKPSVDGQSCTLCGDCFEHCPADAITLGDVQAHIDQDKCIGCAECVAACRFGAVKYDWEAENEILQKSIAEHALGAVKGKEGKIVFFNFLMNIAKDCDCFNVADIRLIVDDIGILASTDPLAIDKASLDMVEQAGGKDLAGLIGDENLDPRYQLEHAEHIGLGSLDYKIKKVS